MFFGNHQTVQCSLKLVSRAYVCAWRCSPFWDDGLHFRPNHNGLREKNTNLYAREFILAQKSRSFNHEKLTLNMYVNTGHSGIRYIKEEKKPWSMHVFMVFGEILCACVYWRWFSSSSSSQRAQYVSFPFRWTFFPVCSNKISGQWYQYCIANWIHFDFNQIFSNLLGLVVWYDICDHRFYSDELKRGKLPIHNVKLQQQQQKFGTSSVGKLCACLIKITILDSTRKF